MHPNLYLQSDWTKDQKILRYTIYSVNRNMMQQWSEDVLTALRHWDTETQPRILFDLTYTNVSMSYFVMSQREIFNVGITPQGKSHYLEFLRNNPTVNVKLAVVLSSAMLGALGKYVPNTYEQDNFTAKIFFDRDSAEDWLQFNPDQVSADTNSITSETLLRVIQELENRDLDEYGDRDHIRIMVHGMLEVLPIKDGAPIIVGRTPNSDLDLSGFGHIARSVSRQHAQISLTQGRLSIIDLNSRNGTRISGRKLEPGEPTFIRRNDKIRVGSIEFEILF